MLKSAWLWIAGSVAAILAVIRGVFLRSVRLKREEATTLYDLVRELGRTFVLDGIDNEDEKLPDVYDALCWIQGVAFRFTIEERMLTAGWSGTDTVFVIVAPRWQIKKLIIAARSRQEQIDHVPVFILRAWDAERIGKYQIPIPVEPPLMDYADYGPLENAVAEVTCGLRDRTSTLLYGPPGNGKSFLARYLAIKYKLPIYLVTFTPDTDNHQIIRMFGHLSGPCIALLEDFDGYFEGRRNKFGKAQFTFDAILNVLDGTYATLNSVVVIMTVNDIEKVDSALRHRPGRLRHVIEVPNPSLAVRRMVFADRSDKEDLAQLHAGKSLDELLAIRDELESPTALANRKGATA